ncbi:MAG: hypothetical protein FWF76_04565 [Oscillospiraceae bacterium]|nr:hypothetical protein [Oscillospiraceae bacterium]
MKYDVFMWTRTFDNNYSWFNKPAYMPINIQETCQSLTALTNSDGFASLSEGDWYSNFYYLKANGCCLLARVSKTTYNDSNGYPIVSFEGVVVRDEEEHRLFYNIPNLISSLLPPSQSFRAKYEDQGFIDDTFEVEQIVKPFSVEAPPMLHPALKNNDAFNNLLKFIAFTEKRSGFMFGKNVRAFSELVSRTSLNITHIFDYDLPDSPEVDENSFQKAYKPIECGYIPPVATGQEQVTISLMLNETGDNTYKYKWLILPWEADADGNKRIRYSTDFSDINDSVELAKLELQKESLHKFLTDNGWKKKEFGLRFEKDIFQREEVSKS